MFYININELYGYKMKRCQCDLYHEEIDAANISYRTHKAYMGILDCLRHNDVRHNDVRNNDVRDNETQW